MQFLYHQNAGESPLKLSDEDFNYLFKVRRFQIGDKLNMRNLQDKCLYVYTIAQVQKKYAIVELDFGKKSTDSLLPISTLSNKSYQDSPLFFHLLWAVIEPKIIEKTLPMLNELGVGRISFFYAQFSQRHFKLSLERMRKILIQSCQQCGRDSLMELEVYKSFDEIYKLYAPFYAFDFGGEDICTFKPKSLESFENLGEIFYKKAENEIRIMVGAEGGFSSQERTQCDKILSLNHSGILRSESACVFLASIVKLWQQSLKQKEQK